MTKSVKILTGILGFFMLIPGLAKFTEPFKTFIYEHLTRIGFPFPDVMQYVVKFSEIGVGLALLYLVFKGSNLDCRVRNRIFYLSHLAILGMMLVAVYTHLSPNVPAEVLPFEFKPPVMPIGYIVLVAINTIIYKKNN